MITLILRAAMFVGGAAYLLNAFLPTATNQVKVERHSIITEPPAESYIRIYTVSFSGDAKGSCSVDHFVYANTRDGDIISVESTRVFKQCVKIEKDTSTLYHSRFWKSFNIIIGFALTGLSLGMIKREGQAGVVGRANK